jgi:hypothetical protein
MKNKRWFLIRFALGMLIIEVYYFATYFMGQMFVNSCTTMAYELNLTTQIESFYWLSINMQREMMNDPNKQIFHANSQFMSIWSISLMQDFNSDMQ